MTFRLPGSIRPHRRVRLPARQNHAEVTDPLANHASGQSPQHFQPAPNPAPRPEDPTGRGPAGPEPNEEAPRPLECRSCGCRHFIPIRSFTGPGGRVFTVKECRHCGRQITAKQ